MIGLRSKNGSTLIDIVVVTNADRNEISGFDEWRKRLILRVKEKPIQNKANIAIIKFFSEALGVSYKDVRIVSGEKGNLKTIEVNLDIEKVREILEK